MANSMISNSNDNYIYITRSFETFTFTVRGKSYSASLKRGHGIPPELWGVSGACRRKHKKRR